MQEWKSREWKTRHQTAGVENAGVTSMESQNSRYLTLLQVGYTTANRTNVNQKDFTHLHIFIV